ncbi:LPS assembly lipoprotein LptE [Aestuariivirga sp.]|uniref:LPS assembly lipoprotein LptE n=1 Tax=Aestuariivirga sp. TaxID=2650926 RepID=UPI0039E711A5
MRQLAAIALAAVLSLVLAGCGYRPLYGTVAGSNNGTVVQKLADISIEEQPTRAGQLVRNELISTMGGGGSHYLLKLTLNENNNAVASIKNTLVKRHRYTINIGYQLIDSSTGKQVAGGRSFSNTDFDEIREPVADMQAFENARERAAREVAQDLRIRLSAFFASKNS